jgi:hypothetical protein
MPQQRGESGVGFGKHSQQLHPTLGFDACCGMLWYANVPALGVAGLTESK